MLATSVIPSDGDTTLSPQELEMVSIPDRAAQAVRYVRYMPTSDQLRPPEDNGVPEKRIRAKAHKIGRT